MIGLIFLFVFLVTASISLTGVILSVFGVCVWRHPSSRHGPILTFTPILSAAGAVYGAFAVFRYAGLCLISPTYSIRWPRDPEYARTV